MLPAQVIAWLGYISFVVGILFMVDTGMAKTRADLSRPLRPTQAAVVLFALGLLACGYTSDSVDKPDTVADAVDTNAPDTNAPDPDVPAKSDVPGEPDLAVELTYPEGPYGTAKGDIIANLGFYDPVDEITVMLHQWYQDTDVKLLMLISTAGW